jgi:hypothetical protein
MPSGFNSAMTLGGNSAVPSASTQQCHVFFDFFFQDSTNQKFSLQHMAKGLIDQSSDSDLIF